MNSNKFRVLSIWDQRFSSPDLIEDSLIHAGIELKGFIRELRIVPGFPESDLKSYLKYQSKTNKQEIETSFLARLRRALSFGRAKYELNNEISRFKPDAALLHMGQTAARFVPLLNSRGIPATVIFYGHDISAALRSKRWRRLYQVFKNFEGNILVLCDDAAERLKDFGCNPKQIHIWSFPLQLEEFKPKIRPDSHKPIRLITAGRFTDKKGYPLLFEALSALQRSGIEFEIEIFGYGPDFKSVLELCKIHNCESNTTFRNGLVGTEFLEEYSKSLTKSDIFIFTGSPAKNGDDEGGPALTLVMAQATGIPIITTDFPGLELSFNNGITGTLVINPNPTSISEAIQDSIRNYSRATEQGAKGAEVAHIAFEPKRQTLKLLSFLKQT